ncbi:hypothetical protein [Dactylosporangium sp. NPDC006015]|uniref:hypothetical protein n=1 Tax=Dactylosporangium sp. NPDC006015 TaxID=3154576 RepID=UPI0033A3650D
MRHWLLSHQPDTDPPPDLGHLAALAGAAAVRAGTDAWLWVPVRDGVVHLPGLGSAVTGPAPGGATLSVTPVGFTVVASGQAPVAVSWLEDRPAAGPGWLPARHAGPAGWRVLLDDLDPGRDCHGWAVTGRLGDADVTAWDGRLSEAWTVLAEQAPEYLPALRAGVRTVVPLRADPGGALRGATHRDAFAAVGLAEAGGAQTAVRSSSSSTTCPGSCAGCWASTVSAASASWTGRVRVPHAATHQ